MDRVERAGRAAKSARDVEGCAQADTGRGKYARVVQSDDEDDRAEAGRGQVRDGGRDGRDAADYRAGRVVFCVLG